MREDFDKELNANEMSRTKLVDKIILLKREEKGANRRLHRQVGVNKLIARTLKEINECRYRLARTHREQDCLEEV